MHDKLSVIRWFQLDRYCGTLEYSATVTSAIEICPPLTLALPLVCVGVRWFSSYQSLWDLRYSEGSQGLWGRNPAQHLAQCGPQKYIYYLANLTHGISR